MTAVPDAGDVIVPYCVAGAERAGAARNKSDRRDTVEGSFMIFEVCKVEKGGELELLISREHCMQDNCTSNCRVL